MAIRSVRGERLVDVGDGYDSGASFSPPLGLLPSQGPHMREGEGGATRQQDPELDQQGGQNAGLAGDRGVHAPAGTWAGRGGARGSGAGVARWCWTRP